MTLEQKMDLMLEEMFGLRSDVNGLREDVKKLGDRVDRLENEVQSLGNRMDRLENEVQSLGKRVDRLENEVQSLGDRVDRLEDTNSLMRNDIAALKNGQLQEKQELHLIKERVTVTYNLALENWGQIVESKVRLKALEGIN